MKKISFVIAGLFAILFSACSEEDIFTAGSDTIEISAGISPVSSETRANIASDGKGSFTSGDNISLFILPEYAGTPSTHRMTYENGSWMPRLSWTDLQADRAFFSAYYPELPQQPSTDYIHTVALDQREVAAYEKSDLLYASTHGERNQPVELNFQHAMSLVSVTLRSNGAFTDHELASAVVSVNGCNNISFNLQNATMGAVNGSVAKIIAKNLGNGSYQAVVCPQDIRSEWHSTGWIEIQIGGRTLQYKAPEALTNGDAFQRLESGKKVSFTINLNKEEAQDDWSNKTVWVYGLKDMPPVSEWGYAYIPPHDAKGLTWDRKYGWYDCNKKFPIDGTGYDSSLCWAAASANIIYWWLDQNKENVARYGYNGPHVYNSGLDCEIFELYKRNFKNEGNFVQTGLNWYFRGTFGGTNKPGAGFFKDLFEFPPFRAAGPTMITEDFKHAFTHKEAIAFCVDVYSGRASHALNIWGADFDENGEVCAIYMVDNNDREIDEQPEFCNPNIGVCQVRAGLVRKGIKIKPDGPYMESGYKGQYTLRINQFIFMSTSDAEWAEYFRKHPEK